MSTNEDRIVLAGEYVLGVLEAQEQREAQTLLAQDAAFRAAVADWRLRLEELDATASEVSPSPGLWRRIESAIAQAPPAAAEKPATRPGLWRSLTFWRAAALALAAACIVLVVGTLQPWGRPQPVVIAVLEAEDGSSPGAIVEAYADGSIRLVPLTDIPVPPGRALQVWTLWDQARGPVPLGLLDRARNAVLSVDGQPRPQPQQLYEITLEPASGSPTGRPTGPILYKGLAAVPR